MAALSPEGHRQRDGVIGFGRHLAKRDEAHVAKLMDRSASSGDHRR